MTLDYRGVTLKDLSIPLPDDIKLYIMKWFIIQEGIFTYLSDVDWDQVSEDFIEQYVNVIDMNWLIQQRHFSELFIEKHLDRIDKGVLLVVQNMCEEFAVENIDLDMYDATLSLMMSIEINSLL